MAYALFNPYLFQEAKANIDLFESVMMRNGFPKGSKMINLIEIVRDHEFVKITPHLIYNEFTNYQDPKCLAELSEDLGEAMVGINENEIQLLMAERGK